MKKEIQADLTSSIKNALRKLGLPQDSYAGPLLDYPTDERFGELTSNIALRISKVLNRPAGELAETIAQEVKQELKKSRAGEVTDLKVEGSGFLNFYLKDEYFYAELKSFVKRGEKFFQSNLGKSKRVLLEFVSANPTGPLSVAHARQAAVGDALANILYFLGFKVKREYYLNDEGNQINILGESVHLRLRELSGEKIEFPAHGYQGDYIYDIARSASEKKGKIKDWGAYAARYILKIIKKELRDFGVRFDYWYSQKKLRQSGKIDRVLGLLKKRSYLYEEAGALWFKSTAFGDDRDRVVVKSDAAYTYLAPDIAYHQDKYQRGFSWLINLWGPDHHGYVARLKAAIQALGHDAGSLAIIIVQLATILKEGKVLEMSTRKGQYITLREVLEEVGRDATRFFFLMRRTLSHLDFDLELAKKETPENPVYYVQYAQARIQSILRHSRKKNSLHKADFWLLREKEELALMKKILQFSHILEICYSTLDPYPLTVYLQELSETFHKFYDLHRVLGQDPHLSRARLALISAARITLSLGLKLLGVACPRKM